MRTADIEPLTAVYAIGDRTPGPAVFISRDVWEERSTRFGADDTPTSFTPAPDGRVSAKKIVAGGRTQVRTGLLLVCLYSTDMGDDGPDATEPEGAPERRALLPEVAARVAAWAADTGGGAEPELPKGFQIGVINPRDVLMTRDKWIEQRNWNRDNDARLAAERTAVQDAQRAARARIAALLDEPTPDDVTAPLRWTDGAHREVVDWCAVEALAQRYAATVAQIATGDIPSHLWAITPAEHHLLTVDCSEHGEIGVIRADTHPDVGIDTEYTRAADLFRQHFAAKHAALAIR